MNYLSLMLSLVFSNLILAQQPNPVHWTFSVKKINVDTLELDLRASIAKGWHIYSQNNEGGPGPTTFSFNRNPGLKMTGDTRSFGRPKRIYEALFKDYARVFFSRVVFCQLMVCKDQQPSVLTGMVKFMACDGRLCLPPKKEEFSIAIH